MIFVKIKLDKSGIHGIGCFADQDIAKGTIIWKFSPGFDQEFSREFIDSLSESARSQVLKYAYISKKTGNYILCSDDTRFFNHSDNNNVKNVLMEGEQEGVDIAIRDIKKVKSFYTTTLFLQILMLVCFKICQKRQLLLYYKLSGASGID